MSSLGAVLLEGNILGYGAHILHVLPDILPFDHELKSLDSLGVSLSFNPLLAHFFAFCDARGMRVFRRVLEEAIAFFGITYHVGNNIELPTSVLSGSRHKKCCLAEDKRSTFTACEGDIETVTAPHVASDCAISDILLAADVIRIFLRALCPRYRRQIPFLPRVRAIVRRLGALTWPVTMPILM